MHDVSSLQEGLRFPLARALSGSLAVRTAGAGVAFGLHALLARLAGADQYGAYTYVLTWVGVMAMVVTLGLDVSLVKYVAAYRAQAAWPLLKGLVRWSHRWVLVVACLLSLTVALLAALGRSLPGASLVPTIWMGCGVLPILALLRLSEARLAGLGRVVLAQLPDGILRPAITAGMAALMFWWPGRPLRSADAMALHLMALAGAAMVAMALLQRQSGRPADVTARYDTRAWLRASLPLWSEAGLRLLSTSLDVILVGVLLGMAEAGVYGIANRLAELIAFGTHASQATARPHIAAADARGDRQALQRAVTAASTWATVFALVTCCALIPARSILLRQFGEEFVGGSTVLLILAAGYLVSACTAMVHAVMNMTDHQRANMRITAVMLAVKAPLSYLAIMQAGMIGAAIVSSGVTAFGCLWGWSYVRRVLGIDGTALRLIGPGRPR